MYIRVNVPVARLQSNPNRFANFVRLGLPGSKTNTRYLRARVQGEEGPEEPSVMSVAPSSGVNLLGTFPFTLERDRHGDDRSPSFWTMRHGRGNGLPDCCAN